MHSMLTDPKKCREDMNGLFDNRQLLLLPVSLLLLLFTSSYQSRYCMGGSDVAELTEIHGNRLANETSPYLLQHADNPVDWYPWGSEALSRAKKEDKPILLSIGYSSCHWCHVMERESFANKKTAAIMNEHFVCIKIDREERPDLDKIYMKAVQMMTGSGGWPLTVFLTPDLKPFFGGTYFPPIDRYGMVGFPTTLQRVAEIYRTKRSTVEQNGSAIIKSLQNISFAESDPNLLGEHISLEPSLLDQAAQQLISHFDAEHGGFGSAPKFPQSAALLFLMEDHLRTKDKAALTAVELTLRRMADGGIWDHLAGGFHRYSVDALWQVPHFEKMLYDNALLARTYLRAWHKTANESYAATTRNTLDFLLKEMRDPDGGFYASLDADTDHEEGTYYIWTVTELQTILGEDTARRFAMAYGVTRKGNFGNGKNILYRASRPDHLIAAESKEPLDLEKELALARAKLLELRSRRTHPSVDRKVLTAWNGMAIASFALAGMALEERTYVEAARRAADFILSRHKLDTGIEIIEEKVPSLAHSSINGSVGGPAFLDDYAHLIVGLLDLYHATLDSKYLIEADRLGMEMLDVFCDSAGGALFYTAIQQTTDIALPIRPRMLLDGAVPSPVAVALEALLRLADLTGKVTFSEAALMQERSIARVLNSTPGGSHYALYIAGRRMQNLPVVVIVGRADKQATLALLQTVREHAGAGATVLAVDPTPNGDPIRAVSELAKGKTMIGGQPTAYVCIGRTCLPPVTQTGELRGLLSGLGQDD